MAILFDISHRNIFFRYVSSGKGKKIKSKQNDIKLRSFYIVKETINKMKRQPTEWEKIFTNISLMRGKIPKCTKNSYNSIF